MRHKLLHETGGQRTYAVILETGEEVMDCLKRFVAAEKVRAAQLTAIGAFSDAVLLYFNWGRKEYQRIAVLEQVEVASLIGDVAEEPPARPLFTFIWCSVGRTVRQWPAISAKRMFGRRLR